MREDFTELESAPLKSDGQVWNENIEVSTKNGVLPQKEAEFYLQKRENPTDKPRLFATRDGGERKSAFRKWTKDFFPPKPAPGYIVKTEYREFSQTKSSNIQQ